MEWQGDVAGPWVWILQLKIQDLKEVMFLEKLKILKLVYLNPKRLKISTFGNENIKATTMQEVNLIKTTDQKLIDWGGH